MAGVAVGAGSLVAGAVGGVVDVDRVARANARAAITPKPTRRVSRATRASAPIAALRW